MYTLTIRFVTRIAILIIVFSTASTAQERKVEYTQRTKSETVEAILRLERDTMDAIKRKDPEALGKIVADDFIHRSPGGVEAGKTEFLKSVSSLPVEVVEIWGEELNVSVFGETAVLTGVQRVKTMSGDGKEEAGAGAFTDVFVKRNGRWWMVLAYSVDIPVATQSSKD